MALKIPKYLISAIFLAYSLFVINCDSKIEEKPSDQSLANDTQNIPGTCMHPTPLPCAFRHGHYWIK